MENQHSHQQFNNHNSNPSHQFINRNSQRSCDKTHDNGQYLTEFLSDDDNSEKNICKNEPVMKIITNMTTNNPLTLERHLVMHHHQQQQQQQKQQQQQQEQVIHERWISNLSDMKKEKLNFNWMKNLRLMFTAKYA